MRLLLISIVALCLAPAVGLAAGKAPEPATAAWDDPAGDVRLAYMPSGLEGAALPALADALDITSVAFGNEDDEGFDVVLGLANIDAQQDQLTRTFADVNYMVGFDLTDSPFHYTLHLSYAPMGMWDYDWDSSLTPAITPMVYGYLFAGPPEQADSGGEEQTWYSEGVAFLEGMADFDANTLAVRVPRAALERAGPGELTLGPAAGDQLTNLQAESFAWWPAPSTDLAPDEGVAEAVFEFQQGTANSLLRFSLPDLKDEDQDDEPEEDEAAPEEPDHPVPTPFEVPFVHPIAVNPGAPTQMLLQLENRGADYVGAQLTARVESEATGFEVRVADIAPVVGGQTVLINLVATLDGAVEHRAPGVAIVEAASPDGDLARIAVPLIASAGPTTAANVLRLHSAPWTTENPLIQTFASIDPMQMTWLNVLEADPLADDAPIHIAGPLDLRIGSDQIVILGGWGGHGTGMDTPLARPLALVEGEPVLIDVGLRSSQAESGKLTAVLYAGENLLAEGSTEGQLSGETLLSLELVPDEAAFETSEPMEGIGLWLTWEPDPLVPEPIGLHVGAARDLWLLPALTTITLPLDPEAEQAIGPMIVVPEPTEEQKELDSSALQSRDVPGFELAFVVAGVALAGFAARRRRA
ncbi:MAG TPA: hypothetical protein VGR28_03430 [Candidatus Thermoplasmatota archaeon]|jgi:hypothetical protein|nr:hypothetical protein [Candidatus Thermoplasmatota archaeon]